LTRPDRASVRFDAPSPGLLTAAGSPMSQLDLAFRVESVAFVPFAMTAR
jgi:hypothetical protein